MKKFLKICLSLILLIVLLVLGLHVFLKTAATGLAQKHAIPAAEELLGVDVVLDNLDISLLGGSIGIEGIRIANPKGFTEPDALTIGHCFVHVGLRSGFVPELSDLTLTNTTLVVVRNKKGDVNLQALAKRFETEEKAPTPEEGPGKEEPAGPLPKAFVNRIDMRALVRYIDHKLAEDTLTLDLATTITMRDIATYGDPDALSGTVQVDSQLQSDAELLSIVLDGQVGAITDPARPSFDMEGTFACRDLTVFGDGVTKIGIQSGGLSGTLRLVCRRGTFVRDQSAVNLTLNNIKLDEKVARDLGGFDTLDGIPLSIPIGGTLLKPEPDYTGIRSQLLAEVLSRPEVRDDIIKKLPVNKDVKNLLNSLFDSGK